MSRYLKDYITDVEIIFLVLNRMLEDSKNTAIVIPVIELILELCS